MKKLLVPSLLAGLLICIPTIQAQAQILTYQPYSWDTTGKNTLTSYTAGGVTYSESILTTPGPAGLQVNYSFSANAPSGVGGYDTGISSDSADSVWSWSGGGTPANYHDISAAQATATASLPNSSAPPATSSWAFVHELYAHADTDTNFAYVEDYGFSIYGNNSFPYQDVQNLNFRPGKAYLSGSFMSIIFTDVYASGTTAQLSYTAQATATYVVP